jgi:capsular polysaccharide transport system permease protein
VINANTIPARSVSPALTVQSRVITALILREVHTLYGNTRLGYLWAIIQTAFNLAFFWLLRDFLGFHAPHGTGIAVFLLCGFIPWFLFRDIVSRCMSAVRANQSLLTFPQVTDLDLMLARTVVIWGTQLICAIAILSIAAALEQPVELRHPGALAATLIFAPLLGIGIGLVFASLARLWPTLERLVPILMRFLFFASGVFFQVSELPARFSDILLLNPVAQIIEWQRYGFSASSSAPVYNSTYVVVWCILSLCFGLLLERYVRGRELK